SGAPSGSFSHFFAFGDSTIDSGWFPTAITAQPPQTANETGSPPKDTLIANAVTAGGTGTPVGLGDMVSQVLAGNFGFTISPANDPNKGADINYAIAGATTDEDAGGTSENTPLGTANDPGNAQSGLGFPNGIGNLNKNFGLPSTFNQIETYLADHGGSADPSSFYLKQKTAYDITFATNTNLSTGATGLG